MSCPFSISVIQLALFGDCPIVSRVSIAPHRLLAFTVLTKVPNHVAYSTPFKTSNLAFIVTSRLSLSKNDRIFKPAYKQWWTSYGEIFVFFIVMNLLLPSMKNTKIGFHLVHFFQILSSNAIIIPYSKKLKKTEAECRRTVIDSEAFYIKKPVRKNALPIPTCRL